MSEDVDGSARALYAAGFNAHGQIDPSFTDAKTNQLSDCPDFRAIGGNCSAQSRVLFAGWSTTVIINGNRLFSLGHQKLNEELDMNTGALRCAIGDEDGMLACLDEHGRLNVVEDIVNSGMQTLVRRRISAESPRIGQLARAENGRIAMSDREETVNDAAGDFKVIEFEDFADFLQWYDDPNAAAKHASHFRICGSPVSLQANIASFLLLTDVGHVYTWGDNRYQSLGRDAVADDADRTPGTSKHPSVPGRIDALLGEPIRFIAAGGWQAAAISNSGALYIWGAQNPGSERHITSLSLVPNEVRLVSLLNNGEDIDPQDEPDVLGVSIGNGHMVVMTEEYTGAVPRLYAAGGNRNGQLARGFQSDFEASWALAQHGSLGLGSRIQEVICGPVATFVRTDTT